MGMILFHLSFVSMFSGIIYNSLFYFRGIIRLTEGETLSNGDPLSYDLKDKGRFFRYSMLKGTTTFNKLHVGYKVSGQDKRVAYEIAVGEPGSIVDGIIYLTKNLDYNGFRYFPEKEGYSILTLLNDSNGKLLYGAYIPLQSFKQQDNAMSYSSGTASGAGSFPFPQYPVQPLIDLQLDYRPDPKDARGGEVAFQIRPVAKPGEKKAEKPSAEGKAVIGARFNAADYSLSAQEVRYWVAMKVSYEPGQPIVLTSLWVGLFGVTLTTLARIFKKRRVVSIT
jgi:cytochrome c biogenesis protein ResB